MAPDSNVRGPLKAALAATLLFAFAACASAQEAPKPPPKGRILPIYGTIDTSLKNRIVNAVNAASRDGTEVILFDIQAGPSDFGECLGLAKTIADLGGSVKRKVAYVGKPLVGHAVLVALACDEIVIKDDAKIGDVFAGRGDVEATKLEIEAYREIAGRSHDVNLALTMVVKNLRVYQVTTAVAGKRYVAEDQLKDFEKNTRIASKKVIKEIGERKIWSAREATDLRLAGITVDSIRDAAAKYEIPPSEAVADSLEDASKPLMLKLNRHIDGAVLGYVRRQLKQAQTGDCNLLFVEIDSSTGDESACEKIAMDLASFPGRTVAWVSTEATGPALLVAFGCKELVVAPKAKLGGFRPAENSDRLADTMAKIAEKSKFPEAIVRRLVDPNIAVFEVRSKQNRNIVDYLTDKQLADPNVEKNWDKARPGPIEGKGPILTIDGDRAVELHFAVDKVGSEKELFAHYGVKEEVRVLKPGFVDVVVNWLTGSSGTVFLISAGLLLIYLEMQFPGFMLPGVLGTICFVLFFWSRWLSDMAGSLEIVLFLLGIGLIAVELFVIPGFGVTGITGLALILVSLVLASQGFAVPHTSAEVWQMVYALGKVGGAFGIFLVAAVALGRFLPRLPLFNRFVLQPPDDSQFPDEAGEQLVHERVGVRGIASTPLRPSGRIQVGEQLLDVVAQGEFIEPGAEVEIVEVYGQRLVVRSVSPG